jgi:hypothetical protein
MRSKRPASPGSPTHNATSSPTCPSSPFQPQLKPPRSYERISDALGELAGEGHVELRADDHNVYVLILGRVIVHAARDWLEWATEKWAAAKRN